MGHRSGQNAQATTSVDSAGMAVTNAAKPNAGSSSAHPVASAVSQQADETPAPPPQTATVSLAPAATPKNAVSPADAAIVGDKIPAAPPQPATSNSQPATSFVVQVAAVSSQDVADILLSSLQKKGYTVAVHHEPQDKLLHVQIGSPFPDKEKKPRRCKPES